MDKRERSIRYWTDRGFAPGIRDVRYLLSQLDAERRMVEAITASRDGWHDLAGELAVERDTVRVALDAEQQRSARLLAVVQAAEWSRLYWPNAQDPQHMCPLCDQAREWGWGHVVNCPIGLALKEADQT